MSYCLNPKCTKPADTMNANGNMFCRNCGANLLIENRYRVIKHLGSGGLSRTFEVEDNRTKKILKVLSLSQFSSTRNKHKVINLFKREAEVLSHLNNSGIPKVEPDGYFELTFQDCLEPLHCLVMEKIEGLNLQQWLENQDNKPVTPEQAIAYLKQLIKILAQVHAQGYFHRDIKPNGDAYGGLLYERQRQRQRQQENIHLVKVVRNTSTEQIEFVPLAKSPLFQQSESTKSN